MRTLGLFNNIHNLANKLLKSMKKLGLNKTFSSKTH